MSRVSACSGGSGSDVQQMGRAIRGCWRMSVVSLAGRLVCS